MVRLRESPRISEEDPAYLKQQIQQLKAQIAAYEDVDSRAGSISESPSNTHNGHKTAARKKRRKKRSKFSTWSLVALTAGIAMGTVKAITSSGDAGLVLDVLDNSIRFMQSWASLMVVIWTEFWKHCKPWLVEGYYRFVGLSWVTKLYILYATTSLVFLWLLRREIRKRRYVERVWRRVDDGYTAVTARYRAFATAVRDKSILMATLLPHLILLGGACSLMYLFPEHVSGAANGFPGFLLKYLLPLVLSLRAVVRLPEKQVVVKNVEVDSSEERTVMTKMYGLMGYASETDGNGNVRVSAKRKNPGDVLKQVAELSSVLYWLRYWTVMGTVLALERLPFIGSTMTSVQGFKTLKMLLAIWLQFPGTSGASLAFAWIIPVVNRYFREVDAIKSGKPEGLLSSILLSFLDPPAKAKVLEVVDASGTFVFMALPFFFMPFFTDLGCVLFGLVRVIHASITVALGVENISKDAQTASRRRKKNRFVLHDLSSLGPMCVHWLEYWIIYPPAMYLFNDVFGMIPFMSHAHLLFILWLQIPFFRKSPKQFLGSIVNRVDQWVS